MKKKLNILVVEDDDLFRSVICEDLTLLGHNPKCVASAEQALSDLAKFDFDLLITDINLQTGSGLELVDNLKQKKPNMPVILMSGYSKYLKDAEIQSKVSAVLSKPFKSDELQGLIESVTKNQSA